MNTLKLKRRLVFMGMIAAVLFALTPSANLLAGEPGTGECEGLKFESPPFMGDITVTKSEEKEIYLSGTVNRVGNVDCKGIYDDHYIGTYLIEVPFSDLKPSDIRGLCLEAFDNFDCLDSERLLTVIAAGNIRWHTDSSFTANFIIMAHEE